MFQISDDHRLQLELGVVSKTDHWFKKKRKRIFQLSMH